MLATRMAFDPRAHNAQVNIEFQFGESAHVYMTKKRALAFIPQLIATFSDTQTNTKRT